MLRGFKYPLEVDNGDIVITDNYPEQVKDAIVHSIQTIKGELVWYPRSGRDWLVWDSANDVAGILAKLRSSIADGLQGFTGVSFSLLGAFTAESQLDVVVNYRCPDSDPTRLQVTIKL